MWRWLIQSFVFAARNTASRGLCEVVLDVASTLVMLLSTCAFGSGPASGAGVTSANEPTPVVYDADMDVDDTATLAYLCAEDKRHRIDLRAVTVDNDGFGTPGRALQHARSVLRQCGLPTVPVADGSNRGVHAAPREAVPTVETVLTGALEDGSDQPRPAVMSAAELIEWAIATSPRKVTVLATGPLSNMAEALRQCHIRDAAGGNWLADRIQGLYVMGGAVSVPGDLFGSARDGFDNSQEFNMWLDPASAREVFHAMRPGVMHLVPLDATNTVPITTGFLGKLGADHHNVSARLVYRIMMQPAMVDDIKAGLYYWWDALTAISAFHDNGTITNFHSLRLDVVLNGVQSGRTVVSPNRTPQRVAMSASRSAFEQTFLNALNGRS